MISAFALIALTGAVTLEAAGQILFKKAADVRPTNGHPISWLDLSPAAWQRNATAAAGLGFLIAEAILTSVAMSRTDVSVTYPLGSLELVVVLLLARATLGEIIGWRRWLGMLLIVAGTILVGAS